MNGFDKTYLLGVGFTNAKEQDILEFIATGLHNFREKYFIVTPNPELLVIANNNKEYNKVLNSAKLALPDGVGVMWAAKLLGRPLQQLIHGVDFTESLCKYVSKRPITVGFLGGGVNVAVKTSERLKEKYPGLRVGWSEQEFSAKLKNKNVDILFVAFGSPKQEIWIYENLKNLPVKIAVGVGGSFDFISGKVPRAPEIFRSLKVEWLFRLLVEPWRIKRQLSLITFIFLVLKEKLNE